MLKSRWELRCTVETNVTYLASLSLERVFLIFVMMGRILLLRMMGILLNMPATLPISKTHPGDNENRGRKRALTPDAARSSLCPSHSASPRPT